MENIQKETPNIWYFFFEWDLNSSDDFIIRYLTTGILKISGWNKQKKFIDRETKLERERESIDLFSFVVDNLEGIEQKGGNEIIRNLYKN